MWVCVLTKPHAVEINVTFVWDKATESRLSTESSAGRSCRSRVNIQDYRNLSSIGCQGLLWCMLSVQVRGNSGSFSLLTAGTNNRCKHTASQRLCTCVMLPLTQNALVHCAEFIDEHNDDKHSFSNVLKFYLSAQKYWTGIDHLCWIWNPRFYCKCCSSYHISYWP